MTDDPCARLTARGADGTTLVACAHGGHLLSWTPARSAGAPTDADGALWLSPLARCGPGEAIRGGMPVIFPQFASRGPLPKHGFARDRAWQLRVESGPQAGITALLTDDETTRAHWPHPFRLTLQAQASADTLTTTLDVANPGRQPFTFTVALHTYLAVRDAGRALLHGVEGAAAEDNAAGGAAIRLPDHPLVALGPRDVAVRDLRGPVTLAEPALAPDGAGRRTDLVRDGFEDVVIWNPGVAHGLADVPADGAGSFVCVEPAQLSPVTLDPDQTWRGIARWTTGPTEPSGPAGSR